MRNNRLWWHRLGPVLLLALTSCGQAERDPSPEVAPTNAGDGASNDAGDGASNDAGDGASSVDSGVTPGDAGDGASNVAVVECIEGSPGFSDAPVVEVAEAFSGSNGVFYDSCEDGNLVQYSCATRTPTGADLPPVKTGTVDEKRIDCGGRCAAAACPNECPLDGDIVRYLSIDQGGETVLLNVRSGWKYTCQYSHPWQGFDCSALLPGHEFEVILPPGGPCTHAVGSLGLGSGIQSYCGYVDCVLTDP